MRQFQQLLLPALKYLEPINGELGRYHVRSEDDLAVQPYHIDIEAYWGNGRCDCMRFKTELEPELSRLRPSEREFTENLYRCKHILVARVAEGLALVDARIALRRETERELERNLNHGPRVRNYPLRGV